MLNISLPHGGPATPSWKLAPALQLFFHPHLDGLIPQPLPGSLSWIQLRQLGRSSTLQLTQTPFPNVVNFRNVIVPHSGSHRHLHSLLLTSLHSDAILLSQPFSTLYYDQSSDWGSALFLPLFPTNDDPIEFIDCSPLIPPFTSNPNFHLRNSFANITLTSAWKQVVALQDLNSRCRLSKVSCLRHQRNPSSQASIPSFPKLNGFSSFG